MAVTEGMRRIVGGVDTHKDLHVAAVVDEQDRVIERRCFATTRQGYRQMLAWMRSFGELQRIGIKSTGSYGAGLLRFMHQAGIAVLEVTTPDKQDRRRRGKNDDLDAQNAAHAAFAGQRTVTPRSRDGMIESLRVLMACRKTAVSARRVALQMIHNTIVCAPDGLRDQLRGLTRMQLVRTLAAWRPDLTAYRDLDSAYRIGLKSLARRYLELHDEIADLDAIIAAIVDELAPNLVACNSIGHIGAAQLLLTAGDNPERLRSEASFASLCGVSPVPASSGKTVRHRLNRGGDRAANSALHIIAIGRLRTDQRTKDYVARRIAEGHSKLDAIRALKRYLAREVFTLITQRRREPGLEDKLARRGIARQTLASLTYTQWEAWLAIGFDRDLLIVAPAHGAERSPAFAPSDPPRASQATHLQRLTAINRYPAPPFTNTDNLVAQVVSSGVIVKALVKAEKTKTPRQPRNLPFASLGSLFMGRDRDLNALRAALVLDKEAAVVGRALHGLGGVGKTRLAIEYAFRHAPNYSALLFVRADDAVALDAKSRRARQHQSS